MSRIKKYNDFLNESTKTPNSVVLEYIEKYPEHKEFFETVLKSYPTHDFFNKSLIDIILSTDEEADGLSDDEILNKLWYPELEVGMLEDLGVGFCGDDIWVDFSNDLQESGW